MGLENDSHTGKTFLQIVAGKIAQRSAEGVQGAVSRENKNKVVVWELHHDFLSGKIKELKIENKTFASGKTKQLEIAMEDGGKNFTLTIPVDSKYFDQFCAKIGNANLDKKLEIKPYSFIPKGEAKKKSGLNIYQDDKKMDYFFSKENAKGKPFPPEDRMDEEDYKVFKIQERKFYCDYINGMTTPKPTTADVKSTLVPTPDDDLPF